MAYASASDVSALCRNLIGAGSGFDSGTCPTGSQVASWLSTGCAVINGQLAGNGYTSGIPTTSAAYEIAQQANALYAAWFAERSRQNAKTTADERTRADYFKRDFEALMKILLDMDLTRVGLTQSGNLPYAGGISVSDKDTVDSNTDRVEPRFVRGMYRNPDALEPTGNDSGDPQAND